MGQQTQGVDICSVFDGLLAIANSLWGTPPKSDTCELPNLAHDCRQSQVKNLGFRLDKYSIVMLLLFRSPCTMRGTVCKYYKPQKASRRIWARVVALGSECSARINVSSSTPEMNPETRVADLSVPPIHAPWKSTKLG